jgi:antitoxin VapB
MAYVKLLEQIMHTERTVSLFRNGRNQAVRIPREFELDGDLALIRKEGNHLVIEPIMKGRLLQLLQTLEPIDEEFPDVDDQMISLDNIEL